MCAYTAASRQNARYTSEKHIKIQMNMIRLCRIDQGSAGLFFLREIPSVSDIERISCVVILYGLCYTYESRDVSPLNFSYFDILFPFKRNRTIKVLGEYLL